MLNKLLLILQRYYFESESQLFLFFTKEEIRCCLSYKDTILKANHSELGHPRSSRSAVAYPTKILFWKRITAKRRTLRSPPMLLLILQRYYFESESQPLSNFISLAIRCCLSYKDTILKANHSLKDTCMSDACAVAYPTKILFWKRITANWRKWRIYGMLLLILQRYYFESESQQLPNSGPTVGCCCLSYKDTILKANHSISGQITGLPVLLLILQRYYFESESQPGMASVCKLRSCCLSYKDTILKANHSTLNYAISFEGAVAYPTKILFWKRITAHHNTQRRPS